MTTDAVKTVLDWLPELDGKTRRHTSFLEQRPELGRIW